MKVFMFVNFLPNRCREFKKTNVFSTILASPETLSYVFRGYAPNLDGL